MLTDLLVLQKIFPVEWIEKFESYFILSPNILKVPLLIS